MAKSCTNLNIYQDYISNVISTNTGCQGPAHNVSAYIQRQNQISTYLVKQANIIF